MSLDPFSAGFDLVKTALDKIFPDADTELKGKLDQAALELTQQFQVQIEQIKTNQAEAQSEHWFAANWRPAVGWLCAIALGYSAILEPLMRFVAKVMFGYVGEFPVIDTTMTMQILFGMLGLGVMRSYDKTKPGNNKWKFPRIV